MKSEEEIFWSGEFGDNYVERNIDHNMFYCFTKILFINSISIKSVIELGANVGINLDTLKILYPGLKTFGVEINTKAFSKLEKTIPHIMDQFTTFLQMKSLI